MNDEKIIFGTLAVICVSMIAIAIAIPKIITSEAVAETITPPSTCSEFAATVVEDLTKVRYGNSRHTLEGYRMSVERNCLLYLRDVDTSVQKPGLAPR